LDRNASVRLDPVRECQCPMDGIDALESIERREDVVLHGDLGSDDVGSAIVEVIQNGHGIDGS